MARKILIVEDNKMNRQLLVKSLSDEYEVFEAENGKEALEILHRRYKLISAVLLDLVMPVMDGYAVLGAVRENAMLSQIPIIVVTASTDMGAESKALALGAIDYITKPYNPTQIKFRLRNTIKLRETSAIVNALQVDKLTGLYNREAFFRQAGALITCKPAGYYVLACFDVAHFKVINDQYGSEMGDEVLKKIAKVFSEGFAPQGGLCCRVMADNFAVLYPRSFLDTPELADIRHRASVLDGSIQPLSFAIGRYIVDDLSLTVSAMYDRAKLAQESTKGRYDENIGLYDESMRNRLIREQQIVTDMKPALEGKQFEVWYQPQYNHSSGALIGAEALVRWRHPDEGLLVAPGEFVPVFERNGFIYELDKFVWEQVCSRIRRWIDEGGSPLPVAVNVSRYDLFREDFIDVITGLVEKYALPIDLLRLEITETAFSESTQQIISVVRRLISHGFTVEIDDFGSGYSSLNTLKDVPASVLKLDMAFLESTDDTQRGGNILESIVRMAKWLGMAVIAEGVETIEQADYLESIGCRYVQGYLYAKPMPVSEYEKLARGCGRETSMKELKTAPTLDNNTFWDPASMDTLIFNSYVGGASIVEFHDDKVELLRANDKYALELGIDNIDGEQLTKLDLVNYLDDENHAILRETIGRAVETDGEASCEIKLSGLAGGRGDIFVRATLRVIAKTEDRRLVYCSIINITEQREAEQKLHETSEQLRTIMQNVNGGMSAATLVDGKIGYIYVNDKYYSMFGYTEEQFKSELPGGFVDIIVPEDMPVVYAAAEENARTGEPTNIEFRVRRRDGSRIWVRTNSSVCRMTGISEPVHIAVIVDETEQHLMSEAVEETGKQLLRQAESDPLTGVLNRTVFAARVDTLLGEAAPGTQHALLMLDIDGFKQLNDTFGHAAGDETLIEIAAALTSVLRQGDLLGRLGGDEFLIFLRDVPDDASVEKKAKVICALARKSFNVDVQISASIGVSVFPRDGDNFDTLYRKGDAALYHVKESGKNSYSFFSEEMGEEEHAAPEPQETVPKALRAEPKRRMLIVDDNKLDLELLSGIFEKDYVIDKANNGGSALMRLRHFGSAVSVVLLDLSMPGIDGFAVLEKMRATAELQAIPVIVVSVDSDRETCMKALRCGAADFVVKPVDPELIRLRVHSAVSRADNERLRAQNSYLLMRSDEVAKYRTVLERTGTAVVEYDWINGAFIYDPGISGLIAGDYDDRMLWHILLSDMVADVMEVKNMQSLVHDVAEDRERMSASLEVRLKTPSGEKHRFEMNVNKHENEYQLTDTLILTFNDLEV